MISAIGNEDANPNDVNTPNQEDECPTSGIERNEFDDIVESNLFDDANDNNTCNTDGSSFVLNPDRNSNPNNNSSQMVPLYLNSSTNNAHCSIINCSAESRSSLIQGIMEEMMDQEVTVCKWKQHCDSFIAQRTYVQKLAKEAKEDLIERVNWPNRRYSFCADYCQNMDLPHFGQEQPGETFYYSPLNISCFGCTDFSKEILDAFIYNEGEGKKGGNNVCSLLYQKLEMDGIIQLSKEKGPGKLLSIVFETIVLDKTKIEWSSEWGSI